MSNYSTLKAAISAVIKENNNHEITGQVLQTTLLAMVDSLAGGYLFKGIATPATVVGTPDENVFYIGGGGVYSNFGATPVHVPDGCIGIFTYNGSFDNHIIPTGGVFDISAYNAVGGTPATYADLTAALGTNGANIPDYLRKGGMSVKFIQGSAPSSDNKYVHYRLMNNQWSTTESDWQGVDGDLTLNNKNLSSIANTLNCIETVSGFSGTRIPNYYIASNGEINSNQTFFYTSPCFVPANTLITVYARGYLTYVAIISICDENGENIQPVVNSTDSNWGKYTYKTEEDTYVIVSSNKNYPLYWETDSTQLLVDLETKVENIDNTIYKEHYSLGPSIGDLYVGYQVQIRSNKAVISSGTNAFKYIVYDIINENCFKCIGSFSSSIMYGAGIIFTDSNNNVVKAYYEDADGVYTKYVSVPQGATRIYVNNNESSPSLNAAVLNVGFNEDLIEYYTPKITLSLFKSIGVIGDSYASGELWWNNNTEYKDDYEVSWGQQMARQYGVDVYNYSSGGLSTRSWLEAQKGLPLLLSEPARDLYLFALGINDYYTLGINYLGSIADITSHESYTEYPDTFYGNYGKIIEQVLEHAPYAKLIMFGLVNNSEIPSQFNSAIQEIANHYNIMYINQREDNFIYDPLYVNMRNGHPTALGYSLMAVAFSRLITKCIINNPNYFINYHMHSI